jgi:NitT/TauT family transport system substrate-binding protein
VAVPSLGSGTHVFLSMMLAQVGLDPRKDVRWITVPTDEAMRLLAQEKVDAFLGFPPEPQELRAQGIGHVLLNTTTDRPWAQYFCCMIGGNREFVRRHPVTTKRALRAILKAADLCALDPERATRVLVDRGFTQKPEFTRQMLVDVPYRRWREYNPEDAVRLYALRLPEAGMIRSSPQKILAQGTDWRFFHELKRELKG